MRYFTVTVHPTRVQIDEQSKEFAKYHAKAVVDGDIWLYKIKKHRDIAKNTRHWRTPVYHNIHYHAHNSGTVVLFEPVHYYPRRVKEISEKQLSLPM